MGITVEGIRELSKNQLVTLGTIAPNPKGHGRLIKLVMYSAGAPADPTVRAPLGRIAFQLTYASEEFDTPAFNFRIDASNEEVQADIDALPGMFNGHFRCAQPVMVVRYGKEQAQIVLNGNEIGLMKLVAMIEFGLRLTPQTERDDYGVRYTFIRRLWAWQDQARVEAFQIALSIL